MINQIMIIKQNYRLYSLYEKKIIIIYRIVIYYDK